MLIKQCSKCKLNKESKDFYKRSDSKDGLTYECKNCKNGINENWRLDNLDKKYRYTKKWQKENPEKYKDSRRASNTKFCKKQRKHLADRYIKKVLKRSGLVITPETIKIKRLQIEILKTTK